MAVIYALCDPKTGEVRYIGKANCAESRLKSHMRDSRKRKTPLYSWIKKHGKPDMVILQENCEDWREAEKAEIKKHRENGARLLNIAEGGDQPFCPLEVRQDNARKVTKMRPENLMYAYRILECNIRTMRRHNKPEAALRLEQKYQEIKEIVEVVREAGRMEVLDAMLGEWRAKKEGKRRTTMKEVSRAHV